MHALDVCIYLCFNDDPALILLLSIADESLTVFLLIWMLGVWPLWLICNELHSCHFSLRIY